MSLSDEQYRVVRKRIFDAIRQLERRRDRIVNREVDDSGQEEKRRQSGRVSQRSDVDEG